jgi:glycine C-acetyltransferase
MKVIETGQGPRVTIGGREYVNLCSNNYLGLLNHSKIKQRTKDAIERYGTGSGAARGIGGTMAVHETLECRLAQFKNTEASLVFQTGYMAGLGTIQALAGRGDTIFSDQLSHACMIDGCRLSGAAVKVYPHNDMKALEKLLKESCDTGKKLIVTDSVFSMDGDIAPLPRIAELAEEVGAITLIDDSHATGVFGRNGRGTIDHYHLHGRIDIQMGTFSKALGSIGGFICGSSALRENLVQKARPFLFSTSPPPMIAASALAALEVLEEEPQLIDTLWSNVAYFKENLEGLGFDTGDSKSPIIPIITGKASFAYGLSSKLFERGIFAQGIGYPTVPEEKSRIRIIVTAAHSREDLDLCLEVLEHVGKELEVI